MIGKTYLAFDITFSCPIHYDKLGIIMVEIDQKNWGLTKVQSNNHFIPGEHDGIDHVLFI